MTALAHNDEGVALMLQSRAETGKPESGEDVELLARALESFDQALTLSPNLPDAVFNRALLFEQMMLPQRASEEWQAYLKLDAQSPWAEEARRNFARLEQAKTKAPEPGQLAQDLIKAQRSGDALQVWAAIYQHRNRTGSIAISALLDQYLAAWSRDDKATAKDLGATVKAAGAVEFEQCGDRFHSDLVAFYLRAGARWYRELESARAYLTAGTNLLDQAKIEDAGKAFAQAAPLFLQAGDEIEGLLTQTLLLRCQRGQAEAASRLQTYEHLLLVCARYHYRWLRTQILTGQAQVEAGSANYPKVIFVCQKGVKLAQDVQDTNIEATFLLQMAESHYQMGEHQKALALYHHGLELTTRPFATSYPRWTLSMLIGGSPLNHLGWHQAALVYQQESLRLALAAKMEWQACRSHLSLCLTYGFAGNPEKSAHHAEAALALAQAMSTGAFRTETLTLAWLSLGQLHNKTGDFVRAAEDFDRVAQLSEGSNVREAFEYATHKGKLIASLARDDVASVEKEIEAVIDLFDRYRSKIHAESQRNAFFDLEQNIYDIAINFHHTRKADERKAFELAESSRARTLLDLVSSVNITPRAPPEGAAPDQEVNQFSLPLDLLAVQTRMPRDAQLIEYAVLKDRLLIWLIQPGRPLVVKEQPFGEAVLQERVSRYLQFISHKPSATQSTTPAELSEAGRQLYEILLSPIAASLDAQRPICLIPDKVLNQLPFAALISSQSNRFLLEDFTFVYAPSATMFVLCSEQATAKEKINQERALAVGDPAFNHKLFTGLPDLPDSRDEVKAVVADYPGSRALVGAEATKQRVEQEMGSFDLIHFSLHCLVNDRVPMRSRLLLARPEAEVSKDGSTEADESVLQAYEIYQLPLARARLVVLAACQSGVGRYYGGEGVIGISRPFIAKRIPLIVASLWSVDATATSSLMVDFHRQRSTGHRTTAAALRQSQLDLLHGSDANRQSPFYWAAFVTIGGHARF